MRVSVSLKNTATPEMRALLEDLKHIEQIHATIAIAVERLVLRHIRTEMVPKPNQLNAPSTKFWHRALSSVSTKSTMLDAEVSIPARGVALQYYGGRVTPKNKQALTIPISAAAHDKWVGDFPKSTISRIPSTPTPRRGRSESQALLQKDFYTGSPYIGAISPDHVLEAEAVFPENRRFELSGDPWITETPQGPIWNIKIREVEN